MKKNFKYAFMSAIAFAGAVSFSACSSNEEVIDNPDYNPETKSVKTTISLSINPNNGTTTRQADNTVQISGNFNGIGNILCLPLTGDITDATDAANTLTSGKLTWDPIGAFDNNVNYKLYTNQDVTVGVDHFLFIGKAPNDAATSDAKLANGFTSNTLATAANVGAITVSPVSIVASDDITTPNSTTKNWKYQSDALAQYLTDIAGVSGWSTTGNASLLSMYQEFTRTAAHNAGSAESVRLLLTDLYNKLDGVTGQSDLVTSIRAAIEVNVTVTGSAAPYTIAWKSSCVWDGFPTSFGLPEGSAEYKWNATSSKFEYITDATLSAMATPINNFVYPNELYYLTKTPLRATTSVTVDWPNSAELWKDQAWTSWTTSVEATSKNIALKYNINYGSALLATTIKAGAAKIYDNARQLDPTKKNDANAVNNEIVVNDGNEEKNPFTLTGILVGAQPSSVGWNFLPSSEATFTKVVYDNTMNGAPINVQTTANTTPNYTLVFDDYKAELADVNVCLEFKNNLTTSFYGKNGIILPGQTFYIVGKLKLASASPALASPIPASGTGTTDDDLDVYYPSRALRAFIQDYTTVANFTITAGTEDGDGDGSLAQAVTTIPDLRTSSQTIGLSVDLVWATGLTYSVNLGE